MDRLAGRLEDLADYACPCEELGQQRELAVLDVQIHRIGYEVEQHAPRARPKPVTNPHADSHRAWIHVGVVAQVCLSPQL